MINKNKYSLLLGAKEIKIREITIISIVRSSGQRALSLKYAALVILNG